MLINEIKSEFTINISHCLRFLPDFKTIPYWGSPQERKVLRGFWSQVVFILFVGVYLSVYVLFCHTNYLRNINIYMTGKDKSVQNTPYKLTKYSSCLFLLVVLLLGRYLRMHSIDLRLIKCDNLYYIIIRITCIQ